jgi:biopolymer transport protein ExbB/TolQ
LSHVLKAGLLKANKDKLEIQNSIDEATLEVLPKLQKRTQYLAMLANISTLLGLLGTIQGLIQSFSAVNLEEAASRTGVLAQGISIAMYTTAFGLIVAIPCLVAYSFLQSKTVKIVDEIDQYSVKLVNLLSMREKA